MPPIDPFASAVVRVLRVVLPKAVGDDVIGDLVEHYGRRRGWRRVWLAAEAAKLGWTLNRRPGPQARENPVSGAVLVEMWIRDIRYASRSLFRSRSYAAVALSSLALGLGLATAVFSVVNGVLLRPLPYGDPDAIVRIRDARPNRAAITDAVPRALLWRWETSSRVIDAVGAYSVEDARIGVGNESFVGVKVEVGEHFFDVLRTAPAHGRLLGPNDDDRAAPMVALLSNAFWQRAFSADPRAIGRVAMIDDRPAEIVGVLPAAFVYPSTEVALYLPGRWRLPAAPPGMGQAFFGPPLEVLARMRPGSSPSDVAREAGGLTSQLEPAGRAAGAQPKLFEVMRLQDDLAKGARPALLLLMAAAGCVLAIVCVNLTSLLLARATVRQREMAVRASLGASRWAMARPLAIEGMLLSLSGGLAGLAIAWLLVGSISLTSAVDPMLASRVRIDGPVLAFAIAASTLIGVFVGMLPAWQAPSSQLRSAGSPSHVWLVPGAAVRAERLRGTLVVVQIALAMVLAVAATLLARSLVTLANVDLGFQPEHALSAQVRLSPDGGTAYGWRARFYEDFLNRLAAHSSVRAAGFTSSLPMRETFSQTTLQIDGVAPPDTASPFRSHREIVTPGYFAALGLPVTNGRGFLATDTAEGEPVAVVNETFAASFLPDRDPLGARVMAFGTWHRVVGVVKSKRHAGLKSDRRPELYLALAQSPPDFVSQSSAGLIIRATGDPRALVPFVRSTLRSLQPQAALENEGALTDALWSSTAQPRFYATVMSVFAALALATALVGLYGVLSYVVERRRVEIGVRRALGATSRNISGLVFGRGAKLIGLAVPLGLVSSAAVVTLLRKLLFGVEPLDPVTFALVTVVVPAVAMAASVWPARRAARIAPLDALRDD
jgi:predicted permease